MSQTLILCEGYDDRAFLKCWLLRLGATDLWLEAGSKQNRLNEILRAAGAKAAPGDYCLRSRTGQILTIRPSKGEGDLWSDAETALKDDVVSRLVINCDSDRPASDPDPAGGRMQRLELLRGDIEIDLVVWRCGDGPGLPGVPDQQTLERLICASIAAAQPEQWRVAVESFLRMDPVLGPNHKNYAHAYWAKFFAHDFDDLYSAVWSRDRFPEIAQQLEERLRRNGDWDRIAALVEV